MAKTHTEVKYVGGRIGEKHIPYSLFLREINIVYNGEGDQDGIDYQKRKVVGSSDWRN